jgi:hypothetical protein
MASASVAVVCKSIGWRVRLRFGVAGAELKTLHVKLGGPTLIGTS